MTIIYWRDSFLVVIWILCYLFVWSDYCLLVTSNVFTKKSKLLLWVGKSKVNLPYFLYPKNPSMRSINLTVALIWFFLGGLFVPSFPKLDIFSSRCSRWYLSISGPIIPSITFSMRANSARSSDGSTNEYIYFSIKKYIKTLCEKALTRLRSNFGLIARFEFRLSVDPLFQCGESQLGRLQISQRCYAACGEK